MFKPSYSQGFSFIDITNSQSQALLQHLTPFSYDRISPYERQQENSQDIRALGGDINTQTNKSFCLNTPVKLRENHGNNSVKMSSEGMMSAFLNKNSAEHLHKNFSPFYSPSCFQQIPLRQRKFNGDSDKSEIVVLTYGTDRREKEENNLFETLKTYKVNKFQDVQGEILRQKLEKAQEDIDNKQLNAQNEGQELISLIAPLRKHFEDQNEAKRRKVDDYGLAKFSGNNGNLISLRIKSCNKISTACNNNKSKKDYLNDSDSIQSSSLMHSESHNGNISAELREELNRSFNSLDSAQSKNELNYKQVYNTRSLEVNNCLNRFTSADLQPNSNLLIASYLKIYSHPRKQSLIYRKITRLSRRLGEIQAKQIIQDKTIQSILFLLPSTSSNNKTDLANKMFQCKFCLKSFPKSCSLGGHISRVHKGKSDLKNPQLTSQKVKKELDESPLIREQNNVTSCKSPTEKKKQPKDEEFLAQSKQVTKKISKSSTKMKQVEQASFRLLGNLKKDLFSDNNLFAESFPLP